MAYLAIAAEVLKNPDLSNYLSPEEIPIFEIRDQILNAVQREALENQGLTTLQDLSNHSNLGVLAKETKIEPLILEKLSSAIDLLIRGSKIHDRKVQAKKLTYIRIVFFGLDQAGKSSLIKYIRKKEPLTIQHLLKTRPTIGNQTYYDLKIREIPVILSELGGQNMFRDTYVKNLGDYFKDTHIAVFVIDSQSPDRFDTAFSYFSNIIRGLQVLNPPINLDIKVAVHKTDQGAVESSPILGMIIERLAGILNKSVIEMINSTYSTSLYDYTSVSTFFSSLLEEYVGPTQNYVKIGLSTLISVIPFEFCCLVDPNLSRLPLGWVVSSELDSKTILNKILMLTEDYLKQYPDFNSSSSLDYTININKWIREMVYLPISMPKIGKKYLFIYCFKSDIDYGDIEPAINIENLVVRALEQQLELANLAIESQQTTKE